MHGYIRRNIENLLHQDINNYPATAILGPRQCGKSTTARNLKSQFNNFLYIDLEKLSDIRKLEEPELFFKINKNSLICLDEIQKIPELFPVLRSILDENNRNGQVIILGSAGRDLLKQSSESLAGRISYIELTPFLFSEINKINDNDLFTHWLRGGFPRSFIAENDNISHRWRKNFIKTFLERDIPLLGFNIPINVIQRLWQMCAHSHGQVLNSSRFGESLGVSYHTIRNYTDILEKTFMLRTLYPLKSNLKKRIIKSPKIYIRDSGILHALLDIATFNDLLGHTIYGSSWEGYVIENVLSEFPDWRGSYYRTSSGAEIDLILEKGTERIAVECKASASPQISRGFWNSIDDLNIKEAWIISPIVDSYSIKKNIIVTSLNNFISNFRDRKK